MPLGHLFSRAHRSLRGLRLPLLPHDRHRRPSLPCPCSPLRPGGFPSEVHMATLRRTQALPRRDLDCCRRTKSHEQHSSPTRTPRSHGFSRPDRLRSVSRGVRTALVFHVEHRAPEGSAISRRWPFVPVAYRLQCRSCPPLSPRVSCSTVFHVEHRVCPALTTAASRESVSTPCQRSRWNTGPSGQHKLTTATRSLPFTRTPYTARVRRRHTPQAETASDPSPTAPRCSTWNTLSGCLPPLLPSHGDTNPPRPPAHLLAARERARHAVRSTSWP